MTKKKFFLRNVATIVACLAVSLTFSSCGNGAKSNSSENAAVEGEIALSEDSYFMLEQFQEAFNLQLKYGKPEHYSYVLNMAHKELGWLRYTTRKNTTATSDLFTLEFVVDDVTLKKEDKLMFVVDFSEEDVFIGISVPDANLKNYKEMTPSPDYKDLQRALKFIANELTQMRKDGETEKFVNLNNDLSLDLSWKTLNGKTFPQFFISYV
ncbi:MAG: hypothetical protein LBS50_03255 [Prevotellaceae bacterium]|jgi:hypothetical protein|nr:hypothetical protein [Prevotellaceae bacterium]